MTLLRCVLVALLLAVALVSGRAIAQSLEPLEGDWQQVFDVSWEVGERYRKPRLFGKLRNVSFYGTSQIQLLVEQLDASGRPVTQQVTWLGFKINPGDSAFFDVPVPDRAAAYRVRIYAFSRKFGTAGS
jgi:hypothetical protein